MTTSTPPALPSYDTTRQVLAGMLSTVEFRPSSEHPAACLPLADAILELLQVFMLDRDTLGQPTLTERNLARLLELNAVFQQRGRDIADAYAPNAIRDTINFTDFPGQFRYTQSDGCGGEEDGYLPNALLVDDDWTTTITQRLADERRAQDAEQAAERAVRERAQQAQEIQELHRLQAKYPGI